MALQNPQSRVTRAQQAALAQSTRYSTQGTGLATQQFWHRQQHIRQCDAVQRQLNQDGSQAV